MQATPTAELHPNTADPRADHLHYALWVSRAQPGNVYGMKKPAAVEQIHPNTKPVMKPEI